MVPSLLRGRVHYAWIVFGVTLFTLLAAAGIRSTPGVLIVPLEREFGWSRAEISAAVSINLLLFGFSGPFAAAFMNRFGIRRVLLVALVLIATGVGSTPFMRAPWQLDLLWGVVVGTGTGAMAGVLATTVANRWFVARRGLVTGMLTAAGAAGQLVFLPGLASLAVGRGWRYSSLAVAVAILVAMPAVALLMRDSPRQIGLRPYGAPEADAGEPAPGNPFGAAITGLARSARSADFWLLAASFFICGATTNGLIGTHLIPASVDHGIPEVTAASMLALIGLFDIIGTTASGWLTDRWDPRWLLFWYYALRGLSLLLLPVAFSTSYGTLLVFIVFYGLDWVATVPPTIALSSGVLGRANGGIVFGWVFASHQLGASFAASAAGVLRTWLGDYQIAFISAGLLCLIASGLVIRIGRAAHGETALQAA
ncbi:MAG TPA: MFS transporter [Candidatus Dormibacteraeota bacterium]|nr:MFS transporter [Candidatus Dormibacteraeota bacterium]